MSKVFSKLSHVSRLIDNLPQYDEVDSRSIFSMESNTRFESRSTDIHSEIVASLQEIEQSLGPAASSDLCEPNDIAVARRVIAQLRSSVCVDAVNGIDFIVSLWTGGAYATQFPAVLSFLYRVSGGGGLERDNHDSKGYHFHYCDARDEVRTNILLTYDPMDTRTWDGLYWEFHGGGRTANPASWGRRRVRAVSDAARPSLIKPGRKSFRKQSMTSRPLEES